jgi:hypothetical protein
VSKTNLVDPYLESQKLLTMPIPAAEALFQSYPQERQLEIISSTRNPKEREELYYLVPDCTELIQLSPTEDVLQVLTTLLGTGLASVLLPCLSSEQFEDIIDLAVWRNGKLDEKSLNLWLFELSECDPDELISLMNQIDIRVIASLLHGRIELDTEFKALLIEAGLVDPSLPGIEYADERSKAILEAIWEADEDLFIRVLYELFALDRDDAIDFERQISIDRAKEQRDERVKKRDQSVGINVTESEVLQKVDLNDLDLDDEPEDEDFSEDDDV